jgi:site-specific DNA recombinase
LKAQYADQLNKESYTTDQGKSFTKVQIKRIFDHEPIYRGTYSYGNVEAVGQHQAII